MAREKTPKYDKKNCRILVDAAIQQRYLLLVGFNHGLEGGQAAADHVVGNAIAQAEEAGAAEAVSGNHQKIVLQLGLLRESVGVTVGALTNR